MANENNPGVTVKPRPETEERTQLMPLYRVLLHNDDVNTMEHVVRVLQQVFHFELQKAMEVMLTAHHQGVALCAVEPLEKAEFHAEQILSAGLGATIEPDA